MRNVLILRRLFELVCHGQLAHNEHMAAELIPKERDLEKDASRAKDQEALATGRATAAEIQRRNAIFVHADMKIQLVGNVQPKK